MRDKELNRLDIDAPLCLYFILLFSSQRRLCSEFYFSFRARKKLFFFHVASLMHQEDVCAACSTNPSSAVLMDC
jgi:hypothetical protein